ncbi:uncharacterized protein At5g39865 [Amaranthus tricolor]|uniref:uncharacterized protein At5g39865 n=1 Tax=Amaranthus tricolor TaxID=29722 RepID=UPI0025828E08|nr:uncharacterized protein At5g39865 [Amaranthus tricolor]
MWRPWGKSLSPKISDASSSSSRRKDQPAIFRCSSFKDIENLCNNQDTTYFDLNSPSSPSNTTLKRQPSVPINSRRSVFHRVRTVNSLLRQWPTRSDPPKLDQIPDEITTPKTPKPQEARIVVYYTSLRVVRPTFEACRAVMAILQGFQVVIDERDLMMDLGFMSELRELLGLKLSEQLTLPRVFIGGRYVGGSEEIIRLHENGELKKLISGLPPKKPGTCDTCGGYRFILCADCSGSHKIYSEKIGFRSCSTCNENGLVRCPHCSALSPTLCRPILAPINGG